MIKKMTENFGCVIWCGGLNGHYNDDIKRLFPKEKYMHDLPECSISSESIISTLYTHLRANVSPQEFCLRCINLALKSKGDKKK
jgi:hypothetical protein